MCQLLYGRRLFKLDNVESNFLQDFKGFAIVFYHPGKERPSPYFDNRIIALSERRPFLILLGVETGRLNIRIIDDLLSVSEGY